MHSLPDPVEAATVAGMIRSSRRSLVSATASAVTSTVSIPMMPAKNVSTGVSGIRTRTRVNASSMEMHWLPLPPSGRFGRASGSVQPFHADGGMPKPLWA